MSVESFGGAGHGASALAPHKSDGDLRVRMVPLALLLARLGSVAQFLSALREALGERPLELVEPFDEARESMRRLQSSLLREEHEDAEALLEGLREDVYRLRALVCDVDAAVDHEALGRYLEKARDVRVEQLCRVIDFYGNVVEQGPAQRRKLLVMSSDLAHREGLDGESSARVQREFRRREILKGHDGTISPTLLERAQILEAKLLEMAPEDESDIERAQAEAEQLIADLGTDLQTLAGLSLAVALRAAVRRLNTRMEEAQLDAFDDLIRELDDAAQLCAEEIDAGPIDCRDDDPEAQRMLEEILEEINTVGAGGPDAGGLHLDEGELAALSEAPEFPALTPILVRSAVVRSCIDRLARRHARARQPDGEEPAPVPRDTAFTLMRRALGVERELADLNQDLVIRCEIGPARVVTRSLNRLARARLGLGILADIQIHEDAVEGLAPEDAARRSEEEKLREQLQTAVLMRDALRHKLEQAKGGMSPADEGAIKIEFSFEEQKKTRKPLLVALGICTVAAVAFHLWFWKAPVGQSVNLEAIQPPIPMSQKIPAGGTFVATTTLNWKSLDEDGRELRMRKLFDEARAQGFTDVLLVDDQSGRPLGRASAFDVEIYPEPGRAPGPPSGNHWSPGAPQAR